MFWSRAMKQKIKSNNFQNVVENNHTCLICIRIGFVDGFESIERLSSVIVPCPSKQGFVLYENPDSCCTQF
jgi:hypothetical protein